MDAQNQWQQCEVLSGHGGLVRDCKWAPSLGRSYQLIATASSDGHVRIYQLSQTLKQTTALQKNLFTVKLLDSFELQSQVWSLSWNLTGTILCSSGDDGICRLFKGKVGINGSYCVARVEADCNDWSREKGALNKLFRWDKELEYSNI